MSFQSSEESFENEDGSYWDREIITQGFTQ
jgi:hypothetical protein